VLGSSEADGPLVGAAVGVLVGGAVVGSLDESA
jgi:hypothetical protein